MFSDKKFKKKINKIYDNNILLLGIPTNKNSKISCSCNKCKNFWETTPKELLKGKGCPICGEIVKKKFKIPSDILSEIFELIFDIILELKN